MPDSRRNDSLTESKIMLARIAIIAILVIAIFVVGISNCIKNNCSDKGDAELTVSVADVVEDDRLKNRPSLSGVQTYPRLVNVDNRLESSYVPGDLRKLYGIPDGETVMLDFETAEAFYELYNAMLEDGLAILPLSGYRSYSEQVALFNYNVELHKSEGMSAEEATAYTRRFVSVPGASEHQYGRSIDVTLDGTTDHEFHKTEQGQWLIDHAHEYGFIIRYPEDKEDITGISYEPWHLRYVGKLHAEYMHEYNLCLEEYVSLVLKDNPSAQPGS